MNEKETIEYILKNRNCINCNQKGELIERKDVPIKYVFECKNCGHLNEYKVELEDKK